MAGNRKRAYVLALAAGLFALVILILALPAMDGPVRVWALTRFAPPVLLCFLSAWQYRCRTGNGFGIAAVVALWLAVLWTFGAGGLLFLPPAALQTAACIAGAVRPTPMTADESGPTQG